MQGVTILLLLWLHTVSSLQPRTACRTVKLSQKECLLMQLQLTHSLFQIEALD
jgi:hypothetical protein